MNNRGNSYIWIAVVIGIIIVIGVYFMSVGQDTPSVDVEVTENAMEGDATEGDAMEGDSMKHSDDDGHGHGDAMEGDAMKGDAMEQ